MKKTVTPLRSLCAALAALVLLLALAAPAFAAENGFADLYYRMNDNAQVLTGGRGQRAGSFAGGTERPPEL